MDERPRLTMINVVTRDMDASLAFYELLGLDVADAEPWRVDGVGHHVEAATFGDLCLDMDSTALAAQYDESRRDGEGPACTISDPDGNSVGIMSPRDPSLGGPPPAV